MKITHRYVLKEHLGPLVFALSALTSLLLLNFIARRFQDLVGKGLPWTVIGEMVVLSIPLTFAMTLPMAVLVATLHAFSRMAAENEITAFKASGVSMQRLVAPVILASFGLAFGMVVFNDQVLPRSNHRLANLQTDIARVKPTLALSEQVINEIVRGQLYLRAARIESGTNRMHDVTIFDLSNKTSRRSIVAESGDLAFSASGEDLMLTLYDGNTIEIGAKRPERVQRSFFERDLIRVRGVASRLEREEGGSGYRSEREMTICELHWRVRGSIDDRDSAWVRLNAALHPDDSQTRRPPREFAGLADPYCRVQRWWRELKLVREAEATPVEAAAPDVAHLATVPAPALRAQTPQQSFDEARLEILRYDLTAQQSLIDSRRVEIEKKFAMSFACIVFVLLGAPIALRFPRGGVGLTIGVSLGVFALYYVGLLFGESLADRGFVDPAVAMWGTNWLFGALGIYWTIRLGSEGSTSRGSETSEWWSRTMDTVRARWRRLTGAQGPA